MREEGMNCKDIYELLTAYLDGEVTPEERTYIEAHLPGCPQCRAELEGLSATQASLRGVLKSMAEEVSPPAQAWEKVHARLDTKGSWLDGLQRLLTSRTWQVATVTAAVVVIAVVAAVWQFGGVGQPPVPAPAPTPAPAPAPAPAPMPAPSPPFEVSVVPEEAHYLPGEPVEVTMSLSNLSSAPITIAPYPPEIRVTPRLDYDQILFSVAAGTQSLQMEPGDTISRGFTWDQKDADGNQVSPGWYNIVFKDMNVTQDNSSYGFDPTARILIQYPQGAMEKSLDLNQSQTVDGVTVTLERIELTSEGSTFQVFFVPPGYTPAPTSGEPPPPPGVIARAEYSMNGITWDAGLASFGTRDDGIRLIWGGERHHLSPVPANVKEVTFTINEINSDLGNWEGPWEFRIPLDDDSSASQNVTVSQLISQPNTYDGQIVTLEAYFFYGIFNINALADSAGLDPSDNGQVVPVGAQIRVNGNGNIFQEFWNQLYIQDGESPTHPEYFGKLRITGKFEIDEKDGQYQIAIASAEVLEWMPPFTSNGNLQIKIEAAGGQPLSGAKVVSGKQPEGQQKLAGITDDKGTVTFSDIKQGAYEFTVSLADYIQMDIRLAVTGGRTVSDAFSMAHIGEAPDDVLPAPGLGPQYRANMHAQGIANPWPPIQSTTVTLGTSSKAVQITYRDYIETEAGQTRNNIFYMYRPGSVLPLPGGDTTFEVNLIGNGLPSGITVTQDWQWRGPATQRKTGLKIRISQEVKPGEYAFGIDVEINGEDYGTVPCTIKVIE